MPRSSAIPARTLRDEHANPPAHPDLPPRARQSSVVIRPGRRGTPVFRPSTAILRDHPELGPAHSAADDDLRCRGRGGVHQDRPAGREPDRGDPPVLHARLRDSHISRGERRLPNIKRPPGDIVHVRPRGREYHARREPPLALTPPRDHHAVGGFGKGHVIPLTERRGVGNLGGRSERPEYLRQAIRISTAVVVIAVAAIAAYVSYWHAYEVVRAHGEVGVTRTTRIRDD